MQLVEFGAAFGLGFQRLIDFIQGITQALERGEKEMVSPNWACDRR